MKSQGISTWKGNWKHGTDTISIQSGILKDAPVSYESRFEGALGASPEELLAAAHAACFNQALANIAGKNKRVTQSIHTTATIELGFDESNGNPEIKSLHFVVESNIPGINQEQLNDFAEKARLGCTISKIIKLDTTVNATLIQ